MDGKQRDRDREEECLLLEQFWNEVKLIHQLSPEPQPEEQENRAHTGGPTVDGEEEECLEDREWLENLGLEELERSYKAGRPISEPQLITAIQANALSSEQAATLTRRVHDINQTLTIARVRQRHRYNRPANKPHVSQLFRPLDQGQGDDADYRSRSATPDSLDCDPPNSVRQPLSLSIEHHRSEETERGLGVRSRPHRGDVGNQAPASLSHEPLFRRSARPILASETADGITMVGYQRIGSVRLRERSKSETECEPQVTPPTSSSPQHRGVCHESDEGDEAGKRVQLQVQLQQRLQLSKEQERPCKDLGGFQQMWAAAHSLIDTEENGGGSSNDCAGVGGCGRTRVDYLAEGDLMTLRPLIFLELTTIMDKSGIRVGKLKPDKSKYRKQDGILFGVSLATLLEKDRQITVEPHSVPLIFQKVMGEVERRGLREEGVLRIAGNGQRVENLCSELERQFFRRPELADHLLASATVHELTTLLKRLIRALPQPLLTSGLIHLFYRAYGCCNCLGALNMLVLLLPSEHRATLHAVLTFLSNIVSQQAFNKMSAHNVATIIAPSLFPPNIVVGKSGLKAELSVAVECCRLTEVMMAAGSRLWLVPDHLMAQLRNINQKNKFLANSRNENAASYQIRPPRYEQYSNRTNSINLRIEAPQFLPENFCTMTIDKRATVGDIVLRVVEMGREAGRSVKGQQQQGVRDGGGGGGRLRCALSELAPNGNLSCLLSTGDPDTALATHFLYEFGGNIGQRRLEVDAKMAAVYKLNPDAQFVIRCDHRNGSHRIFKQM